MTFDSPPCDQYTVQGDLFSPAILDPASRRRIRSKTRWQNMRIIDALFESADTNAWQAIA